MVKPALLLSLFALVLSACTFAVGLPEAQIDPTEPVLAFPTLPPASATPLIAPAETTPEALPAEPAAQEGLLYFWPATMPSGMKVNTERSFSTENGYRIEITDSQTGASLALRAGSEADRYPYCAGQQEPYKIRNVEGCSTRGTGGGSAIEWKENGVHYSVGGLGSSMETVSRFCESLVVLDYQAWQQAIANASKVENTGQTSSSAARIRIEFAAGTTTYSSAYRELGSGSTEEYVLKALQGQELAVDASPYNLSDSANLVISVYAADGSILAAESGQRNVWSGVLPATQDYVIRVKNNGNTAQYRLNVSIPWRINFAAGATSASLDGKLIAGSNGNLYFLRANAGQTLSLSTASLNQSACLTVAAKMTDGSFTPLLNSASQPMTSWNTVLPTGSDFTQEYSILVSLCPESPAIDTFYTLFVDVVN